MGSSATLASLTGIRGVAALWVLLYHVQAFSPAFGLGEIAGVAILRDGWSGVDLFFILSGFVLMHAHEDDFRSVDKASLLRFAKLRFLRIYPLSTAVLLLIALLVAADPAFVTWYRGIDSPASFTLWPFFKTLFLATRWFPPTDGDWNQPVWSLSAEIFGYAAFPWLAYWIGRCPRPRTAFLVAILSLAILAAIGLSLGIANLNMFRMFAVTRMAGGFIAGMALCKGWRLLPKRTASWPAYTSAACVIALLVVCFLPDTHVLMTPIFGLLILSLAFQVGLVSRALSSPPAMFLGRISFPLYLVHVTALLWLRSTVAGAPIRPAEGAVLILGCVACCIGLATLLHHLVERPCHRFARIWARGPSSPIEAASSPVIAN